MNLSQETLTAVSLVLAAVALTILFLYRADCRDRIRRLESLNASLGLRLIRVIEIMQRSHSEERARELAELKDSVYDLFRQYRIIPPGMTLNAQGDLNIGGDLSGRDKIK